MKEFSSTYCYRPYAVPHVTKRETDSGRKSRYYTVARKTVVYGIKYSKALCEFTASTRCAGKLIRFSEC